MDNPFAIIDRRLSQIESLLLDLKHAPQNHNTAPDAVAPPFVSKREAAQLIRVCTSTIDNAARAGKLKRHYVGKAVRFDRAQVLALAKKGHL